MDQERRRGFAAGVPKAAGEAKCHLAVARVQAPAAKPVFFNTGAGLQTIWLNGERIYMAEGYRGWHAGRDRIPAQLKAGPNVVVIEFGGQFFLSITDDNAW